jgi:hypothetical protein
MNDDKLFELLEEFRQKLVKKEEEYMTRAADMAYGAMSNFKFNTPNQSQDFYRAQRSMDQSKCTAQGISEAERMLRDFAKEIRYMLENKK